MTRRNLTTNVLLKLEDEDQAKSFEQFYKLAIMRGMTPQALLYEWIKTYNNTFKFADKLVYEKELLNYLNTSENSVKLTRATLRQYRIKGKLNDDNGDSLWATDGHHIVYKLHQTFKKVNDLRYKH